MTEFLSALSSYPTVLCTVLLGVALTYWFLVLVGALSDDGIGDHDAPETGSAEADADAAHGDGDGHTVHDAAAAAGFFGRLRRLPTALAFSLVCFVWWLQNLLVTHYWGATLSSWLPRWIWGSGALALSFGVALVVASALARPLVPVFTSPRAARRGELVGTVVEVRTGRVDRRFGQAHAADGGAGLLLEVRCDEKYGLRRGDRAIVIAYDQERELYEVAPLDDLLKK